MSKGHIEHLKCFIFLLANTPLASRDSFFQTVDRKYKNSLKPAHDLNLKIECLLKTITGFM